MHLNDLEKLVAAGGPYAWVRPECVEGIDAAAVKAMNELRWFRKLELGDDEESPDEIVTDYLWACLLNRERLIDGEKNIPPELDIDAVMLVNASIYLICDLGSSYAGTILSLWRESWATESARICVDLLAGAYRDSSWFVRDILRDFILEMFRYGPLWHPEEGCFAEVLSTDQNDFLRVVFEQGYATIDPQDASLFSDGSKRW